MSKRSVNLLRKGMSPGMGLTAESVTVSGGQKTSSASVTTDTIAVTASTNYDVSFTQPAGTIIKDIILVNAGAIVTASGDADNCDFDMSLGTTAGGAELVALGALLDAAVSSAVTWAANTPLYWIENCHGHAANAFAAGVGPFGGPAVTVAITPLASFYSASERTIHMRFSTNSVALATAATTIKVTANFLYI